MKEQVKALITSSIVISFYANKAIYTTTSVMCGCRVGRRGNATNATNKVNYRVAHTRPKIETLPSWS